MALDCWKVLVFFPGDLCFAFGVIENVGGFFMTLRVRRFEFDGRLVVREACKLDGVGRKDEMFRMSI